MLFANEIFKGYLLRSAARLISPPVYISGNLSAIDSPLIEWGK